MAKKFNQKFRTLLYTPVSPQAGVRVDKKDINYGIEDNRGNKSAIKVNLKGVKSV